MRSVKMKGKTIEEATNSALEVLGAKREAVEVRVLAEGGGGLLGIGGKEAEVEVTEVGDVAEHAKSLLQEILDKMGFVAIANLKGMEGEYIELEIKGEDMGRIIGKDGATLGSLQYLVNVILSKRRGERVRTLLDAEGYRLRRQKRMERMAEEISAEVESTGKEVKLESMSPADRRAIHMALKDNPKITSFSVGEGSDRRLVVAPKK
ncbi:RNA-binding cell elongation regulator Jag/EloR [Candidatus Margulisiibacteriota bacterium]